MPAKYSEGTIVRIKTSEGNFQPFSQESKYHQNELGKVLNFKAVVAYTLSSITSEIYDNSIITLYMYAVELEDGITLSDVTEFQLESI